MAKKEIDIDINVKTDGVDNAKQKVDSLNQSVKEVKDTTVDYGNKVSITYDKAGKATEVYVDANISLTKQVRAVREQMQILTATGKAQSQEFTILQRKYNDLNDNLARNKARSQELFGTLSLLPGPIGNFAQELQMGLDLLKTFSAYKLSDIKNQIVALGHDLGEIVKGFLGIESAKNAASTAGTTGGTAAAATSGVSTAAGAAAGASGLSAAIGQSAQSWNDYNTQVGEFYNKTGALITQYPRMINGVETMTDAIKMSDGSIRQLSQSELLAISSGKALTLTTEGLVIAEKAATFWTSTLGTTIKTVLISTGVLAAIVVIGELVGWLYKMASGEKESEKAVRELTTALEEQQRVLNNDMAALESGNKAALTRAKIARQSEEELIRIQKVGNEEKLQTLRDYDNQLYKDQEALSKNTKIKAEEREKLQKEINDKILKSGQDITKQILENEQFRLDSQLALNEYYYSKRLAELDAAIQLEIDKDVTSGEKLAKLQKQREDEVIAHDKLGIKQRQLLRDQDRKKKEDALKEDQQRIEAFMSKTGQIEIDAIKDNQKREEAARTKKLNDDILALSYDKEYIKSSTQEKISH